VREKIIFSDLAHIILITITDIFLFRLIKKQLVKKRKLLLSMSRMNLKLTKQMSTRNFFVFRFPLAVFNFYVLIIRYDSNLMQYLTNLIVYLVCRKFKLCESIEQIFYFLYLLSYPVRVIFFKFDFNFKESTLIIRQRIINFFRF
jgi:hypothetical protein